MIYKIYKKKIIFTNKKYLVYYKIKKKMKENSIFKIININKRFKIAYRLHNKKRKKYKILLKLIKN